MVMLVDLSACTASIGEMSDLLEQAGREQGLSIRIQREEIFLAMHQSEEPAMIAQSDILKTLDMIDTSTWTSAPSPWASPCWTCGSTPIPQAACQKIYDKICRRRASGGHRRRH